MSLDHGAASPAPATFTPARVPCGALSTFNALGLVGDSPAMCHLRAAVTRYASKSATVLVLGETGVGKELVARALHDLSPRARAPFVAVNIATMRRDLALSELFGHERGAFTGAVASHRGLFEQAHGGTLLLDEIGELDPSTQADLLRVLETREVRPLGSSRPRVVDVRVVAASHRNLAAMVAEGTFRADLYYRLNVLAVAAPPLRERVEDLPALAAHLLHGLRHEAGPRRLTRDALAVLAGYSWPGNVRQLLNVLRRALAHSDEPLLGADVIRAALTVELGAAPAVPYRVTARRDLPPSMVAETVHRWGGNVSRAARELGVARSTVRGRLRAHRAGPGASSPTRP
jgi:two-component system response regulator HydG